MGGFCVSIYTPEQKLLVADGLNPYFAHICWSYVHNSLTAMLLQSHSERYLSVVPARSVCLPLLCRLLLQSHSERYLSVVPARSVCLPLLCRHPPPQPQLPPHNFTAKLFQTARWVTKLRIYSKYYTECVGINATF